MIKKFKSISWIGLGMMAVFGLNITLVLMALIADELWLTLLAILASALQLFLHHRFRRPG